MIFSFLLLHNPSFQKTFSCHFEAEKCYGNEACYFFIFIFLNLSGTEKVTHFTSIAKVEGNVKICCILLRKTQENM